MKKLSFIIALASVVLAMAPSTATYAKKKAVKEIENGKNGNISIKQFTSDERFVYLHINLQQAAGKPATFKISDEMGELLHVERVNQANYTMLVKITPEELNTIELEYATAEGTFRKKYKVGIKTFSTSVVEEVTK